MAQNVICKGHDLERSRSLVKTNGTIGFLDFKKTNNLDLDAKNIVTSALVQKLWSKMAFYLMVANATRLCISHIQTAQDLFNLV